MSDRNAENTNDTLPDGYAVREVNGVEVPVPGEWVDKNSNTIFQDLESRYEALGIADSNVDLLMRMYREHISQMREDHGGLRMKLKNLDLMHRAISNYEMARMTDNPAHSSNEENENEAQIGNMIDGAEGTVRMLEDVVAASDNSDEVGTSGQDDAVDIDELKSIKSEVMGRIGYIANILNTYNLSEEFRTNARRKLSELAKMAGDLENVLLGTDEGLNDPTKAREVIEQKFARQP